ncbi:MFS transporter [Brevibacillus sp. H7]|uniref:MFS transporter n=1 Tax=Brevibacillus sp. H7 TaxID=3349138 RepID=UPI0038092156
MKELWKLGSFRWYWTGLFLSGIGNQFGWMGLTWYIMKKTGSSAAMGGVVLAYFLPGVFAGLVAGVLLDRFDRRKLIMLDNMLRGALFLGLVALFQLEEVPLGAVYLLIVIAGMLSPISNAGAQTLLPQLVPNKDLLVKANGLMESQWQIVYLFGPAAAGVMISLYGEVYVLLLDAVSFFLCAFCFSRMTTGTASPDRPDASLRKPMEFLRSLAVDLRTGYAYLTGQSQILWLIFFSFWFNMAYGPIEVALPLFAEKELAGGSLSLGLLWSALAVGALCGSLLFSAITWKVRTGFTLAAIIVLWGVTTSPLALFSRMDVAIVSMALAGLSFAPFNILYRSYLQRHVPQELLGRVFTSIRTITGLGMPLGAFASGLLIPLFGVRGLFAAGAVACILFGAFAFLLLRRLD